MELKVQALNKSHEKRNFECGYGLLDNYIKTQAKQDVSRDLSACFVLGDENNNVIGYYTLSANSIERGEFPDEMSRKLPPSYQDLPTILLGRLAIDNKYKGNGYGEYLLFDALKRCVEISDSLGSLAVTVDPIDENAGKFYGRYGFISLPGSKKMFIPLKTIRELFLTN
jgi:predicted GNAT family N-acyltransferase